MNVQAYLSVQAVTCDTADPQTIHGTAVPWGQVGDTSAGRVMFARGSLPTDHLPPLLLHHDAHRPVGKVTGWEDTEQALTFTARVSDTSDGRDALTLARDGALTGISVGVDADEHTTDPDTGILTITAATWSELSMVTLPAFDAARIAAAQKGSPVMSDTPPVEVIEEEQPPMVVSATAPPPSVSARTRLPATVDDMLRYITAERANGRKISAALADITTTETVSAPNYQDQLDEWITGGTPVTDSFLTRSVTSGQVIYKRQWKVRPVPGEQSAEKTQIATNAASFEYTQVKPDTYAWGADVSQQNIDDAGASVISDLVTAATEEIALMLEAASAGALHGAATPGPTTATLEDIGTAIGLLGKFNADVIVAAPDVFGALWVELGGGGPARNPISANWPMPRLLKSLDLPAGTAIVGDRRAARTTFSGPARMQALEVANLGVNIAVYRYAVHEIRYPAGLIALGPAPVAQGGGSGSGKGK